MQTISLTDSITNGRYHQLWYAIMMLVIESGYRTLSLTDSITNIYRNLFLTHRIATSIKWYYLRIITDRNYQLLELPPINVGNSEVFDRKFHFLMVPYRNFHSYHLTLALTLTHTLTHTPTHTLTHTLTHPLTHTLTHTYTLTHILNHTLTHTLTHTINHSLTHTLNPYPNTYPNPYPNPYPKPYSEI